MFLITPQTSDERIRFIDNVSMDLSIWLAVLVSLVPE